MAILKGPLPATFCGVANFEDELEKNYTGSATIINFPCDRWKNIVNFLLIVFILIIYSKRIILILHEFRGFRVKGIILRPLLIFPKILPVVSSEREKAALRLKKAVVLDIPSNIARHTDRVPHDRRTIDFVYFGQIAPNKGIETFFTLAQKYPSYTYHFVGSRRFEDPLFTQHVISKMEKLNIEFSENLPPQEVSKVLSRSKFAVYDFPQGIENKRGSVKACITNGVAIFGNPSADLSPEIEAHCIKFKTEEDIIRKSKEVRTSRYRDFSFADYAASLKIAEGAYFERSN